MNSSALFRRLSLFGLVVLSLACVLRVQAAGQQLWSAKLPGDAKWHALTDLGTLLVGTSDALLAYDPETGAQLWTRGEFKKTTPFNAKEVPGTPYLACNSFAGLANMKSTLMVIDYLTGKTVWQAPEMIGQFMGTIPVPEKNLLLFLFGGTNDQGGEAGTYLRAFDLTTGEKKWVTKFCKTGAIPLHMADNSGKFMPTMDLSGHYEPIVDGDEIYLPYLGVHCLDLNTGAIKWGVEFAPGNKGLKRTYAPLRIDGDRIYAAGGGSVYAIDRRTGATLWKSDRISSYAGLLKARNNAIVSQLEIVEGRIFARYGGNFSNGQAVVLAEPLGVVALDPATGDSVYHFEKAKEGITNLMVLPEIKSVLFADAHNLYGIDTAAAVPAESFHVPIEFKRKMGGGEVAQIGLGALGGLSGLAKAGFAQSKARLDVPVAILRRGSRIVVQGKQHVMCFDPATKNIAWSTYCAAPSEAFGMTALFAVTALTSLHGNAVAAQSGFGSSGYDSGVSQIHSGLDRYNKEAGKRKSATKAGDNFTFMLTKVDDGSQKGVGLLGINLGSGEGEKKFVLGTKEPDYRVDEAMHRLFFFKGKDTLVAYGL